MRNVFSPLNGLTFLITEALTICLSWNILPAFRISNTLSGQLGLVLLMTAIPLALLHLSFAPKPTVVSLVVLGAWLAGIGALFVVVYSTSRVLLSAGQFEIHALFFILLPGLAGLCYAASRFRIVLLLLLVGGTLVSAWFTLLRYATSWIALVVFVCCVMLLLAVQFYGQIIARSRAKKTNSLHMMLTALTVCLLCLGISGGIYGILSAAHPPVRKLSLLTNSAFQDLGKQWGFTTVIGVPPQLLTPQRHIQQQIPSNQALQHKAPDIATSSAAVQSTSNPLNNPEGQKTPKTARLITYFFHWPILLMVIGCVLLALFLVYLGKTLWRRHWYRKLKQFPPSMRVIVLYCHILHVLAIFEKKPKPEQTLWEYADTLAAHGDALSFDVRQFSHTTAVYSKIRYGHKAVNEQEYRSVLVFACGLLRGCRRRMNIFKFGWKYLFV